MSSRFVFDGLEQLKDELRTLPADLTAEASHIVEGAAHGAASTVKQEYHVKTGALRDDLDVNPGTASPFGVSFVVKDTDPIAWLYDNGSQARHWLSGKSTGTMWGHTPPTHLFVSSMIRARLVMYEQLKELLVRKGLSVSGDA